MFTWSPCCLSQSGSLGWKPGPSSPPSPFSPNSSTFAIFLFSHPTTFSISFFSRLHLLLIPHLLFPLNAISMMASVYMTLALAVERCPLNNPFCLTIRIVSHFHILITLVLQLQDRKRTNNFAQRICTFAELLHSQVLGSLSTVGL